MKSSRSGFSLIELIVSVGLFAVVMLISTGAYLSLVSLDRKARATNDLVTNLSFAIDTMERSLRTGSDFTCTGTTPDTGGGGGEDCRYGSHTISFTDDLSQSVTYKQLEGAVQQCVGLSCSTLTDPRVNVSDVTFYVRGQGTTDSIQPWVTYSVKGTITPDAVNGPITFTIQSTASQRKIDL
ncbi:MAG: putative Type IV pilus pilin [Parcubacteria bacterium C7867-008]|nr:MAG: putative Type IV pilus pilin [Parcubacteria bacterium C7867-008]